MKEWWPVEHKEKTAGRSVKKRPAARLTVIAALAMAPVLVISAPASASSCHVRLGGSAAHEATAWTLYSSSAGSNIRTDWPTVTYGGPAVWWGSNKDVEFWSGNTFRCPVGSTCTYSYGYSETHSSTWSIGAWVQANPLTGSLASTVTSALFALTPNYNRTSSFTESYTWTIALGSGEFAKPAMYRRYQHQIGHYIGAWASGGSKGTPCTIQDWQGNTYYGYTADFYSTWYPADWNAWQKLYDYGTYDTWY